MRVALCEEYSPKEGKIKISENIMLTSPKSGFGVAVKNGNCLTFLYRFYMQAITINH